VNYWSNKVTPIAEPVFCLLEHTDVDDLGDGQLSASSEGRSATFGEKEWHEIVEKGGDFSVVGVTIDEEKTVPLFNAYVDATRAPRTPVVSLIK
jgi:hypothetical protein